MYMPRLIIFTDGSINDQTKIAGSSAIVYDTKKRTRIEKTASSTNGTNNIGELVGIELALSQCVDYREDTPILIVSDSKYAMDILQKFHEYYMKILRTRSKDPYESMWIKKENEPYKNQDTIKRIHKNYLRIFTNIKYIHINSHLSPKKKSDVHRVVDKFAKQGLKIDDQTAKSLIEGNKIADEMAKEACS